MNIEYKDHLGLGIVIYGVVQKLDKLGQKNRIIGLFCANTLQIYDNGDSVLIFS